MSTNFKSLATGLALAAAIPSLAAADGKLTVRGGYGGSFSDYLYAYDEVDQTTIDSSYGEGFFGQVAYSNDAMFGAYGGELSFTYNRLSGDSAYDDGGRCSTLDIISLSHDLCMEGAETSSGTWFGQFRAMAAYEPSDNGLQILGGLSVLDFSSDSHGMMIFPGEFSEQRRATDYTGLGLVIGARKSVAISQKVTLQLEGFAGAYTGNRDLRINDEYEGAVGALSSRDRQTVFSLDLAASVALPVDKLREGSLFEVGVAYSRLFNVMDTTNYNPDILAAIGSTGSLDADVDALSLFFGVQIPM
ncbi:hypothetical protein [Ruegeria sp.]|uniref:hypothetical protein n=1 Tax=Ruegeria sp. TaxID=1879320 RepID=UPI0023091AF7|nr:hypothetical protein [Ruegeria sp.]MDA7964675.1 hypothetical protein [Ruegeria sp.]